MLKARLSFLFTLFVLQFLVELKYPTVFSLNNLELHNNKLGERHFYTKKILPFTFNPEFALTGFRTTRARCFAVYVLGSEFVTQFP